MAFSPFGKITGSRLVRHLDDPLASGDKWLDPGIEHDVVIEGVELDALEERGKIQLTFKNSSGARRRSGIYAMNRASDNYSRDLLHILAAVIPDREALASYEELLKGDDTFEHALHGLRGMKLKVTFERGAGYRIVSTEGQIAAVSAQTGEVLAGPFGSVAEAEEAAKAAGHNKSYINLGGVKESDDDAVRVNLASIQLVVQAIKDTKASQPSAAEANTFRFKGTAS
jgi:hypothetical protein